MTDDKVINFCCVKRANAEFGSKTFCLSTRLRMQKCIDSSVSGANLIFFVNIKFESKEALACVECRGLQKVKTIVASLDLG